MRVLVCGGRDFSNFPGHGASPGLRKKYSEEKKLLYNTLYDLCDEFDEWTTPDSYGNKLPTIEIISGCARGADTTAIDWAVINWTGLHEYPADWKTHGRGAGPIRNQQMLSEGKPDIVIAFPGGRGTADMVARARKAGVPVREIEMTRT